VSLNSVSPSTYTTGVLFADLVNVQGGANGVITAKITPSAAFDIQSTSGALCIPRMTQAQRLLLTRSNGMMVYDTTLDEFQIVENGVWVRIAVISGPATSVPGDIPVFADTSGSVFVDSGVNITQVPAVFAKEGDALATNTELQDLDIVNFKDVGLIYTEGNYVVGFHPNTFAGRFPNTVFGFANPSSADASVEITQGAFLVSRLTQAEINALISVDGMIVYNTDTDLFNVHQDLGWTHFYSPGVPTTIINTGGNLFIGTGTGTASPTGAGNVAIGDQSQAAVTSTSFNNSLGYQSLLHNTNGNRNNAFGYQALQNLRVTSDNSAFGHLALAANTAPNNCAFGSSALAVNGAGFQNSAFGSGALALMSNLSGVDNCAIGYAAGGTYDNYSECVFIGSGADATLTGLTNAIAIGYNAKVSTGNSIILGDTRVNVGIGTTAPPYLLTLGNSSISAPNFYMANAGTDPAAPTGGGLLYVVAGALKYRGSSGTITTLAPA
jgi:hypothetical protein